MKVKPREGISCAELRFARQRVGNDKSFRNTTEEYQKQIHTNIRELVNEALNYKDKELTKAQIKSVRNEGAKWKSKFEKAGVTFGDKKK